MISCDKCGKWQHAYCMGITQAKFAEFEKRKGMIIIKKLIQIDIYNRVAKSLVVGH